jgi:hypothetical protein
MLLQVPLGCELSNTDVPHPVHLGEAQLDVLIGHQDIGRHRPEHMATRDQIQPPVTLAEP